MNIKIPNLNESTNPVNNLSKDDLDKFLTTFPDNALSWKNATMEIVDCANWIYEELKEKKSEKELEPLVDNTISKKPSEWNKKHKARILAGWELMSDYQKKQFFERFKEWFLKPLNENQQIELPMEVDADIEKVLKLKKNQFSFDCGSYMGTIPSKLNIKFGLFWHAENTTNLGFFLSSVETFLSVSDNKLSSNDIEKLTLHYNKYYLKS